ncbi:unnamed protein product [Pleuronectes platessa]|uniref:Uncharacterized protein n=1 Tax=Pleuronectes platessa TaxID=8262 RepID=A0A9N7TLL7_PLEPL|nr:unnamed protein product [Pleuronectes platessa]
MFKIEWRKEEQGANEEVKYTRRTRTTMRARLPGPVFTLLSLDGDGDVFAVNHQWMIDSIPVSTQPPGQLSVTRRGNQGMERGPRLHKLETMIAGRSRRLHDRINAHRLLLSRARRTCLSAGGGRTRCVTHQESLDQPDPESEIEDATPAPRTSNWIPPVFTSPADGMPIPSPAERASLNGALVLRHRSPSRSLPSLSPAPAPL